MNRKITLLLLGIVGFFLPQINAQSISITNLSTPYTQDFNTLDSLPVGTESTILPNGWYSDDDKYWIDYGSKNNGSIYSYGSQTVNTTDRAFGAVASSSKQPLYGAMFVNNSSSAIVALTISYTAECWRLGKVHRGWKDSTIFTYNIGAPTIDDNNSTWTNVPALNFSTPDTTGTTSGPLDGNAANNQATISYTITNLAILPNDVFWIRWGDKDVGSSDDGLAIDDLTVSFTGGTVVNCSTPTTAVNDVVATASSTTSIDGSFTAVTADAYLVVIDSNATVPAPTDGEDYEAGDDIGTAKVVSSDASTSFSASGLVPNTIYHVYVFPYNNSGCVGGPKYLTSTPGNDTAKTLAESCPEPSENPTGLTVTAIGDHNIDGIFNRTVPPADGYVVVYNTTSNIGYPNDNQSYSVGDSITNGSYKSVVADISSSATDTIFSITGLQSGTKYYIAVIPFTVCGAELNYRRTASYGQNKLDTTTTGTPPLTNCGQPSGVSYNSLVLDSTATTITLKFDLPANADSVLVLAATSNVGFITITDGVSYPQGSTVTSDNSVNATVYYRGAEQDSIVITGLTPNTVYKVFIVTIKNKDCLNGPNYSGIAIKTIRTAGSVGIRNTKSEAQFSIYPNPSRNGLLNVKLDNILKEDATVEVIDMLGRKLSISTLVKGTELQTIDVSKLAKGTYLLNIQYKGINNASGFVIE
ncbi:MAG: T9SS type A sorting domain-containing protein [Chitinophagales bacterium]